MANAKLLVVEDELIVAMDIKNRLENMGYFIVGTASSVEEAMKMATEALPDLVLMDIMLGDSMNGIEIAEHFREDLDIPVIYLTAYADDKTLSRAKITQPFGYILKPFEERELHSMIEIAIYNHDMERELRESRQWLNATLNSIGDAVIATDKDGIVRLINPSAEMLTGWKQNDAIGEPLDIVFNVIDEDTGKKVEDPGLKAKKEGIFYGLACNNILVGKDGRKIPIDIIGSLIKDDKDGILGTAITFYDTIERKQIGELNFCNIPQKKRRDGLTQIQFLSEYFHKLFKAIRSNTLITPSSN